MTEQTSCLEIAFYQGWPVQERTRDLRFPDQQCSHGKHAVPTKRYKPIFLAEGICLGSISIFVQHTREVLDVRTGGAGGAQGGVGMQNKSESRHACVAL